MANKKKLPVSIFELVWYPICALVIIWGLTYVVLGLVTKYNNINALTEFNANFTKQFGLGLYFWGLLIIVIGVVAGVAVMLIFAKTFDRATEREQRRNRSSRNHTHGGGGQHRQRGNSSFYVSIYDAEIYIYL